MNRIPEAVVAEVVRQQTQMGWPNSVPAWAALPDAHGTDRYYRHENLTVALCEQLVEHHSRYARSILERHKGGLPAGKIQDAARHILMARLYRCRYIQLVKQQDSTEDDMPFAHNRW